ncbi:MAG: guanylate kinase [Bacteroidaceae bacterium]|nr:guanylate kinase [Bacteroidaceae bacterium]
MQGKLIIFSAPSGCGKGTIIGRLMDGHPELRLAFSISATSRPPRGQERDGVEYHFLTPEDFRRRIDAGEFIEYVEVYKDRYYGTLRSEVEHRLANGENVVFDIDVEGGCRMKEIFGDRALSLFLMPPSIDALRQRLTARGTETPEVIESRISRAAYEISYAPRYDRTVVNDDLDTAVAETLAIVQGFLS